MFGMGWSEILLICVVALVAIGPDKLPEVARTLAKFIRQARRIMNDVRDSIDLEELNQGPTQPRPAPPPVNPGATLGNAPGSSSGNIADSGAGARQAPSSGGAPRQSAPPDRDGLDMEAETGYPNGSEANPSGRFPGQPQPDPPAAEEASPGRPPEFPKRS